MKKLLLGVAIASLFAYNAEAASLPYFNGPAIAEPNQVLGTLNALVNTLNSNIPGSPPSLGRNLLDNGAMFVNQRAATATAATTSGCAETSYSADRWCADVNMASGAGQLAVITSSPTPPPGFVNASTLVRNSGSLGQPQCALQELQTSRAIQMQGQAVNLSINMQALGGLSADNGNQANLYLITGTGTAQGLGALRSGVGMTTTTKQSSFTISTSTGLITNATTVVAGQPVWMTAATMPTGINAGQIYYVSSNLLNSGTAFTVAATYANAIAGTNTVIPSTGGTTDVINVPYITPVWTGLALYGTNQSGAGQTSAAQAFGQITSQPYSLSSSTWTRYSTGPIAIPTNVTEAAVAVCFWPNANNGSGSSTDGIAFTGAQLEILSPNVTVASQYEYKEPTFETSQAERYYFQINEPAASKAIATGSYLTSTICDVVLPLPVQMDTIPAVAFAGSALSATTWAIMVGSTTPVVLASTWLAQDAAVGNTVNAVALQGTTTAKTATNGCTLVGAGGGSILQIGADF